MCSISGHSPWGWYRAFHTIGKSVYIYTSLLWFGKVIEEAQYPMAFKTFLWCRKASWHIGLEIDLLYYYHLKKWFMFIVFSSYFCEPVASDNLRVKITLLGYCSCVVNNILYMILNIFLAILIMWILWVRSDKYFLIGKWLQKIKGKSWALSWDIHHQKWCGKMNLLFLFKCYLMIQVQRDNENSCW